MPFSIESENNEFDITTLKSGEVIDALVSGIIWRNAGMVGFIPRSAVQDVWNLASSYAAMKEHGRIVEIPAVAYTLYWSMCEDVRCESETKTP